MKTDQTQIATVSLLAEVPETLHQSVRRFLESHPDWDQDRLFINAVALFCIQNGQGHDPDASRVYLDTLGLGV